VYRRKITKPVQGTVSLRVAEEKVKFNVDYYSGIVTFQDIIPKDCKVRCSFEFDVPVRFNNDYLELVNHYQQVYSIDRLELLEIKI
jgi:uncharacterized protein (TIGR02217 family)